MPYIIYLIILLTFSTCHGTWIGFDCGSTLPNITTYSLLDSGECDFKIPSPNSTDVQIELLQIAEFRKTQTIQCKIKIHRTIYHCGIFGHLIPVETGEQNYIYDISHEKCESILETGIFKYDNIHIITDLKSNETTTQGIDFAGSAADSSCVGSSYADHYGSYNNVFVKGTITLQLFNEIAQVNLDQDKIRLSTGTVCKYSSNVFKPNTNVKWIYRPIHSLATCGVYSQSDLQKLHEHNSYGKICIAEHRRKTNV